MVLEENGVQHQIALGIIWVGVDLEIIILFNISLLQHLGNALDFGDLNNGFELGGAWSITNS